MFLSKTRVIGFALGIILLACLMDKELYGYDPLFHEKIVDVTIEMMIGRYPNLPQQYLRSGSTQPDRDRKEFQQTPNINLAKVINDNKEHKRDTTRITRNYGAAIENYKKLAAGGKREEGINQGMRILAKAFHYVSDQTEPDTGRGFSNLMGGNFREVTQEILRGIMANDQSKNNFFYVVERITQTYKFNPKDKAFVGREIPAIRNDLQTRLANAKTINEINMIILIYLEQIVAIQNLMLEQFVKEMQLESGVPQPPYRQTQPSPSPAGRRSITGNWVGLWDTNDGGIRIVQQGNYFIGYMTQVPSDLSNVLRIGEEIFRVRQAGQQYEGEILKIYKMGNQFVVNKSVRLRCIVTLLNNNNLRVTIDAPYSAPTYELKTIIK
ncbi:MAG: hypothetical protein A2Y65_11975 [Deltaproteobacteria bacterium RBG_13_52_11]|nr:MAG: hypothetical protein A2Y65_11975 [Deltaproteobacteria bacterium RBG_13_52_11]